ncbi:hypothetical protein DFH28DRAFT_881504 [Melampsora americana]|nr:hypothetical protein DFH28DRAFT_881504 [Melampsora americana]
MSNLSELKFLNHPSSSEKNSPSNKFHPLQHSTQLDHHHPQTSSSSFNLNFNRRTLPESNELSPYSSSSNQSILNPSFDVDLQRCDERSDQEFELQHRLSQWSFPSDLPVSKREIIWGPYAELSTTDENACMAQWEQTTPISLSKQDPTRYFPPTPTSLKRPRIQTELINERDQDPSERNTPYPKRTRRKSSNETELGSELDSPRIVSPTYERFNQVFSILEGLSPELNPSSSYSNHCPECFNSSDHYRLHSSSNGFYNHTTYSSYQTTPMKHHQTFSWYKPPTTIDSNHLTWWDYSIKSCL